MRKITGTCILHNLNILICMKIWSYQEIRCSFSISPIISFKITGFKVTLQSKGAHVSSGSTSNLSTIQVTVVWLSFFIGTEILFAVCHAGEGYSRRGSKQRIWVINQSWLSRPNNWPKFREGLISGRTRFTVNECRERPGKLLTSLREWKSYIETTMAGLEN